MINKNMIEKIKNKLVNVYDPLKIYIFGSYAWGTPTKDSDLDILIIVSKSDEKSYRRSIKGELALADFLVSRDILVYTKDEFNQRADDRVTLCYKVKHEGMPIYAKA